MKTTLTERAIFAYAEQQQKEKYSRDELSMIQSKETRAYFQSEFGITPDKVDGLYIEHGTLKLKRTVPGIGKKPKWILISQCLICLKEAESDAFFDLEGLGKMITNFSPSQYHLQYECTMPKNPDTDLESALKAMRAAKAKLDPQGLVLLAIAEALAQICEYQGMSMV